MPLGVMRFVEASSWSRSDCVSFCLRSGSGSSTSSTSTKEQSTSSSSSSEAARAVSCWCCSCCLRCLVSFNICTYHLSVSHFVSSFSPFLILIPTPLHIFTCWVHIFTVSHVHMLYSCLRVRGETVARLEQVGLGQALRRGSMRVNMGTFVWQNPGRYCVYRLRRNPVCKRGTDCGMRNVKSD